MGGAGVIVGTTIGLYVLTTICAAIIGVVTSLIFSPFFHVVPSEASEVTPLPFGSSYGVWSSNRK
jgi:Na+/H+-dicarboxylate symporter